MLSFGFKILKNSKYRFNRIPVKMSKNKKYTVEDTEKAIKAVQNKEMSQDDAAATFGVPQSTLSDKLKNKFGNFRTSP